MKHLAAFHSNKVWPPAAMVGVAVVMYGIVVGSLWLVERLFFHGAADVSDTAEVTTVQGGLLSFFAAVYAVYRLWRFHPASNRAYAAWLRLTPWTSRQPLPMGPVHPVWQDAAVVGGLGLLAGWQANLDPLLPLGVVCGVYLVGMSLLLAFTRSRAASLALGFLWPSLILVHRWPWPSLVVIAAVAVVTSLGFRQSLRRFPWHFQYGLTAPTENSVLQTEIHIPGTETWKTPNLGWPQAQLSPKISFQSISLQDACWISLLAGWWSYCIIVGGEIQPMPALLVFLGCAGALARFGLYYNGIAPPFNIRGRIASGRLIIPGFDRALLVPLAAVVLSVVGAAITRRAGAWFPLVEALSATALVFVLLSGGPRLSAWRLTGQHRYRPLVRTAANRRLLKPI